MDDELHAAADFSLALDADLQVAGVGMVIDAVSRDEVLRTLVAAAAEALGGRLEPDRIMAEVLRREELVSSVVAEQIAFPHAVMGDAGEGAVVVAVGRRPIEWDPVHTEVRIVVLFVGTDQRHLPVMARVARLLEYGTTRVDVVAAQSAEVVAAVLARAGREVGSTANAARSQRGDAAEREAPAAAAIANQALVNAAEALARQVPGAAPALVAVSFARGEISAGLELQPHWHILDGPAATVSGFDLADCDERAVVRETGRAAALGRLGDLAALVVVWGAPGSGILSTIRLVQLSGSDAGSLSHLPHALVVQRVEALARTIAREGREGKAVGCFFVVADPDDIAGMTHQLIVNPFLGYPPEACNILDPALEETIKEFAKIDGAFVIASDGTVVSAGTYIAVSPARLEHHAGEGTRHASARALTGVARAVSIVVSESTGRVSVYHEGARV